ncbi:hypothetical protein B7486_68425, partial [cyanobacterium TDX16]
TTGGEIRYRSISGDGTRIAFTSEGDHTGGNPDGNSEIFLVDVTEGLEGPEGTTSQLTDTIEGSAYGPSLSGDGTRIAYGFEPDFDADDVSAGVFLHNTTTGTTTTLVDGEDFVADLAITADGSQIAFASTGDLTGDNADGNEEIFLLDTADSTTTQLTDSSVAGSRGLSFAQDGNRIAFSSEADHTGDNVDLSTEVFTVDITDGTISQVTEGTIPPSRASSVTGDPSVSSDGTRVAFTSDAD